MLWGLIKKELLALIRDVHGMAALFIMPMIFIVIMSLALQNVYNPPIDTFRYAVENQDSSVLAGELVDSWVDQHGQAQVVPNDWRAQIQSGQLDYVLVIDNDFSNAMKQEELDHSRAYVHLYTKPQIDVGAFNAHIATLNQTIAQIRATVLLEISKAKEFKSSLDALDIKDRLSVDHVVDGQRLSIGMQPTAVQQNVPAWLMFGMFFVVASIANLFIQERDNGTLMRLISLGTPVSLMLLSKALPYLLVNAVQAATMLAVGVWLMPLLGGDALSLGGINWPALILVLFSISMAAIGLALTLACVSKTHAQAAAAGPVLNVLMAAIGGVMVPLFVMPSVMQSISVYSPMNWGLNGMLAVLLNGQGVSGVISDVLKLLGFSMMMFVLAIVFFKRRVKS